jgi:hypothetical protein
MSLSGLGWWIVGGSVAALLGGLRWALADYLLDRFGSPLFDWGEAGADATWPSPGAGSAGSDRP